MPVKRVPVRQLVFHMLLYPFPGSTEFRITMSHTSTDGLDVSLIHIGSWTSDMPTKPEVSAPKTVCAQE